MSSPPIRRAVVADAGRLAAYINVVQAEGLDTISRRPPATAAEQAGFLEKMADNPRGFYLAAFEDDSDGAAIVGFLEFDGRCKAHRRHSASLGMSVAKPWRGKGVGGRLLDAAIAEARAWPDFCRIELQCVPWNEAGLHLYRSRGFVVEGVLHKAINLRGTPEDALLMALVW